MNNRHVYIENYYSFLTLLSKYKTSAMRDFFIFFNDFHEIFLKYKKREQV
jgi:hypothetical protein